MKRSVELLSLPVVAFEISKHEIGGQTIDDIVAHFRQRIQEHPCARFIGIFDHYAHTSQLPDGEIAPGIRDARNVVFCFGIAIPHPTALATRPRSIGICEGADQFVVSFLQSPMPLANAAIEKWLCEIAGNVAPVREPIGAADAACGCGQTRFA